MSESWTHSNKPKGDHVLVRPNETHGAGGSRHDGYSRFRQGQRCRTFPLENAVYEDAVLAVAHHEEVRVFVEDLQVLS